MIVHRSLIATTSRTISYDGSCHRYSQIVRDSGTTCKDRSRYATAAGDRSKQCRSVAPWLNRNQSYDPEIVRSGVTVAGPPHAVSISLPWTLLLQGPFCWRVPPVNMSNLIYCVPRVRLLSSGVSISVTIICYVYHRRNIVIMLTTVMHTWRYTFCPPHHLKIKPACLLRVLLKTFL